MNWILRPLIRLFLPKVWTFLTELAQLHPPGVEVWCTRSFASIEDWANSKPKARDRFRASAVEEMRQELRTFTDARLCKFTQTKLHEEDDAASGVHLARLSAVIEQWVPTLPAIASAIRWAKKITNTP